MEPTIAEVLFWCVLGTIALLFLMGLPALGRWADQPTHIHPQDKNIDDMEDRWD